MNVRSLFLACLLLACDGPAPDDAGVLDGGRDAAAPDAGPPVLYAACEELAPPDDPPMAPVPSTLLGTITPANAPLSEPGRDNPASERGERGYRERGLDRYVRAPGWERVVRTELGGAAPSGGARRSLSWFVHYADFQLVDDESPTRLALTDTPDIPGGLRAQEAYLPRAVSAMNRTLAELAAARPFDFGIVTGDCADSAQYNETRWVIDLMNGAAGLHTDSGDDDDPLPGPDNDPKDPFDAVAFPGPWLYVPGNHDVLVVGISLPDSRLTDAAIGTDPIGGTRDWRRPFGAVSTRAVVADPDRRLVGRDEIVQMLLDDTGAPGPAGHGYSPEDDLTHGAHYAYDAVDGLLRILNLDTNDETGGSNGLVRRGAVDSFLIPELERARADGVLVMLASHHSTRSIDVFRGQLGSTPVEDAVPPDELERIVAGYENVIAWLVGHSHQNRVRAVAGPDADHPGYWEIMTSAMSDYPGQARVVELVDNGDGTLSILGTLVDYDEESCMERRYRRLLVLEHVTGWGDPSNELPQNLNVELVRTIPPGAASAVADATGTDRIESETTLRGE
ncbi:MAG: hypothetical protein VYE22_33975 [Myxococcota bacterium]|nr:hypothetical protein [Myxococcota bacterium]